MTPKQSVQILMLSPCYWRLDLLSRKQVIQAFRRSFAPAGLHNSGRHKIPKPH